MAEEDFQQGSLFPTLENALPVDAVEPSRTQPEQRTTGDRAVKEAIAAKKTVKIRFLPNDITVDAVPGESLLQVAHDAGVDIPTGCLRGSCHACEVETDLWGAVCSCIAAVPDQSMVVELWTDPTW